MTKLTRADFLKMATVTIGGVAVPSYAAVNRDPSWLPVAKANGPLVRGKDEKIGVGKVWNNPYVTDGLIAMWDGEWNAGGGIHKKDSTVWKNLVSDSPDWNLNQYGSFNENSFISSPQITSGYVSKSNIAAELSNDITQVIGHVECVCKMNYAADIGYPQGALVFGTGNDVCQVALANLNGKQVVRISANRNLSFYETSISFYDIFTVSANSAEKYVNNEQLTVDCGSWNIVSMNVIGCDEWSRSFGGNIFSIRLYGRALDDNERSHNHTVDQERFYIS